MIVLGIDPGLSGAIAALDLECGGLDVIDMPVVLSGKGKGIMDYHALARLLDLPAGRKVTAYIEQVHAMPKQGISSAFRFGEGYGALQMALVSKGFGLLYITPNQWKKHFGLNSDKGLSRSTACRRFPGSAELFARAKDDGRAEATLIALYGAEKHLGRTF